MLNQIISVSKKEVKFSWEGPLWSEAFDVPLRHQCENTPRFLLLFMLPCWYFLWFSKGMFWFHLWLWLALRPKQYQKKKKYRRGCSLFMGFGYNYAIHKNRPNNFVFLPEINSSSLDSRSSFSFHLKVIKSTYWSLMKLVHMALHIYEISWGCIKRRNYIYCWGAYSTN